MSVRTREEMESMGLEPEEITAQLQIQEDDRLEREEADQVAGYEPDKAAAPAPAPVAAPTHDEIVAAQKEEERLLAEAAALEAPPAPPPAPAAPAPAPVATPAPAAIQPAGPTYEDRIAEVDAKIEDLDKKFDDGDLTAAELRAAMKPLEAEKRTIDREALQVEITERMRTEQLQTKWHSDVRTFLDANPLYKQDTESFDDLNNEVIRLQEAAKAKGANINDPAILAAAHNSLNARAQRRLGITAPAPAPVTAPAAARQVAAKAVLERPAPPPTLGKVPASTGSETDNSEWSWLDRIRDNPNPDDPERYENELKKLSPEKRDAYFQAS